MRFLFRHLTLAVFGLIALTLLMSAPITAAQPVRRGILLAAAGDVAPAPVVWLTPTFLAGVAALVAAITDGVAKIVRSCRPAACPFPRPDGAARCYGGTCPSLADRGGS